MAISAVDIALWDLKARLLGLPLCTLLGRGPRAVPVYGSGGFTAYSGGAARGAARRLGAAGNPARKDEDRLASRRTRARARRARGDRAGRELYVDANGAYTRKQALTLAERFVAECGVTWFEEPVTSDDLDGLGLLRDRAPAPDGDRRRRVRVRLGYFRRMLEAGAVDVLQADVTRCGGITELLRVGALCAAHRVPLSLHCGPSIHRAPGAGARAARAPRVLPRPRRGSSRCCSTGSLPRRRRPVPGPRAAGQRARTQARRRGAICRLSS